MSVASRDYRFRRYHLLIVEQRIFLISLQCFRQQLTIKMSNLVFYAMHKLFLQSCFTCCLCLRFTSDDCLECCSRFRYLSHEFCILYAHIAGTLNIEEFHMYEMVLLLQKDHGWLNFYSFNNNQFQSIVVRGRFDFTPGSPNSLGVKVKD